MMQKKGAIIPLVLGAVVILLMVYGLGNVGYQFAKEKIFGERGILAKAPAEKEFVPYEGPPLTDEERIVLNSVNALRCALNSVALGRYAPDDPKVCPPPLEKAPPAFKETPTGLAWVHVTGRVGASKSYDTAQVHCEGAPVETLSLPWDWEKSLKAISQAILNCKAKALDPNLPQDTRCARIDVLDWGAPDQFAINEGHITDYMKKHKSDFPGWEGAIDWLLSGALQNHIEVETDDGKLTKRNQYDATLCVDFKRGWTINYISVNGCDLEATETFSCEVKNFELPQPEVKDRGVAGLFIQAFGDPRWLVYYESFPPEAAEYWHKEWTDMFNLWTIGTVTVMGVLNMAGGVGGKAAKVAKAAAKEGQELAKKGAKELVEAGVKEAERVLINRLGKSGVENTMKSLVIQESLQGIKGIDKEISEEITETIMKAIGKRTGPRALKKAMKEGLDKQISDIIEKRLTKIPDEFIDARMAKVPISEFLGPGGRALSEVELKAVKDRLRSQFVKEYKDMVKKAVLEGGEIPEAALKEGASSTMKIAGTEFKGGIKELISKDLQKELTKNIIKRRAYEKFLADLLNPDETINTALLRKNGEAALKNLDAIAKINPTAAQKAWAGAREVIDIISAGTFGGFTSRNVRSGKDFFKFVTAQSPIQLSARGFVVGGTVLKTAVGLPRWIATHPFPVMIVLAWGIEANDAMNEKFRPVGGNAVAINQPTLLGPTLPLGLNDAAYDYFITNHDKFGQRMYFVSPCKANLKVFKRKCACYKNPTMHKFTYPTGTINVEPGSVQPLSDAVLEARFKKRWEQAHRQQWINTWRDQWAKLDDETKKRYGNLYEEYAFDQYIDMQFDEYDQRFFNEVISPVGGLIKGRGGAINWLAGVSNVQGGQSARMIGEIAKENYDSSQAIKRCDQSGFVKGLTQVGGQLFYSYMAGGNLWGETVDPQAEKKLKESLLADEYFKPDCLEVEPQRLDGTYCYDYFPATEWIRTAVMVAALVADAIIIGFTGGLATPLALLGTGLAAGAIDVVLEAAEKWP